MVLCQECTKLDGRIFRFYHGRITSGLGGWSQEQRKPLINNEEYLWDSGNENANACNADEMDHAMMLIHTNEF
jgi:hypothetical protein